LGVIPPRNTDAVFSDPVIRLIAARVSLCGLNRDSAGKETGPVWFTLLSTGVVVEFVVRAQAEAGRKAGLQA